MSQTKDLEQLVKSLNGHADMGLPSYTHDEQKMLRDAAAAIERLRSDLKDALLESHAIICATGAAATDQATVIAGIWVRNFDKEPIG